MIKPTDEQYHTCADCGADSEPEPFETDTWHQDRVLVP